MRARFSLLLLVAVVLAAVAAPSAGQLTDDEQRALRERVQARYDVVPLTDGLALRPKRRGDVRLIEISEGAIAINGTTVTGRELRERVGDDADVILRLSYLSPAEHRTLFEPRPAEGVRGEAEKPAEAEAGAPAERPADQADTERRPTRSSGERVRVFGDVYVAPDEEVGEAVAVFGSVKVDGMVRQEVVSVFGSIELGPESVVNGDIVSVGGRVRKAEGARTRGGLTEVSLGQISVGDPDFRMNVPWSHGWGGPWFWGEFGAVPRLIGTIVRLGLIILVTGIALLVARPAVDGAAQRVVDNPVKATLVGLAAQLLIFPVLLMTALVLVVTVIGIPLLVLLPFVLLLLVLVAVVGFTGTTSAIGGAVLRRLGATTPTPFLEVLTGILVVLSPLLLGRMLAVAGWTLSPIAVLLITLGFIAELLAWSSGFGAALTNSFTRWRARRATRRNGTAVAPTPAS